VPWKRFETEKGKKTQEDRSLGIGKDKGKKLSIRTGGTLKLEEGSSKCELLQFAPEGREIILRAGKRCSDMKGQSLGNGEKLLLSVFLVR